jgi:hypothetical protein
MTRSLAQSDIAAQPQLAVLAVVDASLQHGILALLAAHADVLVQAWNPDAPKRTRLAAALVASAEALRHLLEEYRLATELHIIDSIPY